MITDGVITVRPPVPDDTPALVALRDDRFRQFIGEGSADPRPTFCIVVSDEVVGWVDFDRDERDWLDHRQVNIGYALHPDHRGKGCATRAVMLLLHHLAQDTDVETATLLIDPDNPWSLAVPARCGFTDAGSLGDNGSRFFTKPVPPLTYTDGVVTIRPPRPDDLDRDLEVIDDEHIRWIWRPGEREEWDALTADEQRARRAAEARLDDPRNGPKWTFVIDAGGQYAGRVDCDLANRNVPHGEANIGYWAHPAERGKGYVSRAVRLIVRFLAEHTGAREARIGVHRDNEASLRVAAAVGAEVFERTAEGVHHTVTLRR